MSKKKLYSDLASLINATKVEIDESRLKLEHMRLEREKNGLWFNIWRFNLINKLSSASVVGDCSPKCRT